MRLEVVAPQDSSIDQVLQRVEKRAGWILKQRRYFERFQPTHPGLRYVSGETVLYLGRQYRLKVQEDAAEDVKLIGRFLQVRCRDRAAAEPIRQRLEAWYREHAEQLFEVRLRKCLENSP